MLTSISPLGERSRGNHWLATFMWLSMGSVAGGALLGAALGSLGLLIPGQVDDGSRLIVLAVAGLAAAAWDLSGRRFPGWRQVNEDWLTAFRSWVYGTGFGFQLGVAVATVVYTALGSGVHVGCSVGRWSAGRNDDRGVVRSGQRAQCDDQSTSA